MEKLVRKSSEIKIEVNDAGEFITINLADRDFPRRFCALFENVKKHFQEISSQKENMAEMGISQLMDEEIKRYRAVMGDIDNLLGEGTCRKVFGDIVPDIYAITEFFEALIPILKKHSEQRNSEIRSKYSANRRGGL